MLTFAAVGQCKWEAGLTRMFKIAGAAIKNRRELDDETDMCWENLKLTEIKVVVNFKSNEIHDYPSKDVCEIATE